MLSNHSVQARVSRLVATILLVVSPTISSAAPAVVSKALDKNNTEEEVKTLDAVEVRAQAVERREQSLRHVQHVGSRVSIGRERMEQSNVVGSEDLLRYAPNLTIRSRYIGDRNALIGGRSNSSIQGSRSLVYIDGLLISDLLGASFNPPRWGMVSPAEIQTMDVLYGPFSAELPGNSMGTTVQITTRYPREFAVTAEAQFFAQSFSDEYGFKDDYQGSRVNVTMGQSNERWRWFGVVSRLDTTSQPMQYATPANFITTNVGNLPLLNGAVSDLDQQNLPLVILGPTGIEDTQQINAKFKAGVDVNDDTTLEFILGYWQNDYDRIGKSFLTDASGNTAFANNTFSPQSGNEEHWQSALSLTWKLNQHWSLQSIFSDYRITENELRSSTQTPAIAQNGGAGTVSFGDGTGWNTFDVSLDGKYENHHIRVGAHADRYLLKQETFGNSNWYSGDAITRTNAFGGKVVTKAIYFQDNWKFADRWNMGFGARYEQWSAFDGLRTTSQNVTLRYPESSKNAFSPKLSLSRDIGQNWTLRFSAGKAVRFPTVSELFQGSISGNVIINSNPNLLPETSYSKELAMEKNAWGGTMRISFFEDDIHNSLFSQTNFLVFPNVTNIQNIARIRNRGLELVGDWKDLGVEGLSLNSSIAFNQPSILDNPNFPASEGKRAPRIPNVRASTVISYQPNKAWRFSMAGRYSGRQWNTLDNTDINPNTFGGTSNFTVFDVKVMREIANAFTLGLGIDNVTDEKYYVFHPYPSRTLFLELRYGGSSL
jgi:iron complex outermembrane recepter protein